MSVEDRSASTSTGVIRGWGCTPTGDPPAAATTTRDPPATHACLPGSLGRGWRRTCLYSIILLLMVLVFLNISLTLWIIGTLRLNANGIGPIKIIKNGIQLDGQAWIVDSLVASTITSQPAQPVTIHSHRNFTVLVSEPAPANGTSQRAELAKLFIKRDSVVCSGRKFEVRDTHGKSVFTASRDEVRMSADTLAVDGPGGVTVRSAVQTPSVRAPPGSDLQLESLTRRLSLRAPQSIHFESRAGSVGVTSHGDIKFDSVVGAIRIDAPSIVISNLTEAVVTDKPQKNIRTMKVYQLCACATGKLFLAPADSVCVATDDDLCR